jgi:hypothetical protein
VSGGVVTTRRGGSALAHARAKAAFRLKHFGGGGDEQLGVHCVTRCADLH